MDGQQLPTTGKKIKKFLWYFSVPLVVYIIPVLLLPMIVVPGTEEETWCFYVVLLMGLFWCTEIIPLAVTSLIPFFMFPFLGILDIDTVCESYMEDTVMVLIGGIMIAIAVEKCGLHKRIAITALKHIGKNRKWLLLGVMLPTWFISMWISNTATTAMMMPIVDEIISQLEVMHSRKTTARDNQNDGSTDDPSIPIKQDGDPKYDVISDGEPILGPDDPDNKTRYLCKGLTLAVPYAANTGGMATLIGSAPQLILQAFTDDLWERHDDEGPIDFVSWMVVGLPISVISFFIIWLWMELYYIGPKEFFGFTKGVDVEEDDKQIRKVIEKEYDDLGELRVDEKLVIILFIILVLMWFFRDPGFDPAWADLFKEDYITDAVPPILMAFAFFAIPSSYSWQDSDGKADTLLTWAHIKKSFPWDVIVLIGGSLAIADGMEASGLTGWIADQLEELTDLSDVTVLLIFCLFSTFFTEICGNGAVASILLPIAGQISYRMEKNPLYLMLGVTVSVQYTFMLPVSTPPNAIAHATGKIKILDMVKTGTLLNFICLLPTLLAIETWLTPYFDLDDIPWNTTTYSGV